MNTTQTRRQLLVTAGIAAAGAFAGCTSPDAAPAGSQSADASDRDSVVIGSKRFVENVLLAELSRALLGRTVDDGDLVTDDIGARTTVESFLYTQYGGLDHYWEYTGTLKRFHYANDAPESLEAIRKLAAEDGLVVLEPAGFNNTYELVTAPSFAEEHGLETMSDLADALNSGLDVRLSLGDEFVHREDGWLGFGTAYGLTGSRTSDLADDAVVVEAGDTYDQLGTTIDIAMGFSTDPELAELVTLTDDRSFFPTYNPVPILSQRAAARLPDAETRFATLTDHLDSVSVMRDLIARVTVAGESPQAVAESVLAAVES
jgi:osmoprotectant transport system substrate-binding protein